MLAPSAPAQDATPPAAKGDALGAKPYDRVTLVDGVVVDVEPLSPRPLPEVDPKKKVEPPPPPPPRGRSSRRNAAREAEAVEPPEEESVILHLLQGEVRDYKVARRNIRKVEYYEDFLLQDADRLINARDYTRAFEAMLAVRQRDPGWRGLAARVDRMLYEEGSQAILENDRDRGLRLLRELSARRADYPGLGEQLAKAYAGRIEQALEAGAYASGRRLIRDLADTAPDHPLIALESGRYIAKAKALVDAAGPRSGREKVDALGEALRIWPDLEGAAAAYGAAFAQEPTLSVGVADVPRVASPWAHSSAAGRVARLVYLPTLAADDEASAKGERPGQLAARVTTAELGRRLEIAIRPGLAWSDGVRPVTAVDVMRALSDRAVPASPGYNARWAGLVERVEVASEDRVGVRLLRPALRPEAWLTDPVGPAHGDRDGLVPAAGLGRVAVADGPFRPDAASADRASYLANAVEASNSSRVRRIVEVRLPDPSVAVRALIRGDIGLLERVPHDRVAELAGTPGVKVGRYNRPALHMIALDGRNPVLRNRALRRGLSSAVDRKGLLEESVLRRPADGSNLVADGPFVRGSYADAPDVPPLGYDPLLAKMLVAAARRDMGDAPIRLTFEYPAIPSARAVVPKIVETFGLAGVEVQAVERPEAELEQELRAGRKFDLAYRTARCDDPALGAGPLLCPGYDAPPSADALASVVSPRIRQLLLVLERASEWPLARGLVLQIDRESRDELPMLPLWQLQDVYAWRDNLRGPGEGADYLYQGAEAWQVEAYIARDSW